MQFQFNKLFLFSLVILLVRAYLNQLLYVAFVDSALLRDEMLFSLLKTPFLPLFHIRDIKTSMANYISRMYYFICYLVK